MVLHRMSQVRHDWRLAEVQALFALRSLDLILRAQSPAARAS